MSGSEERTSGPPHDILLREYRPQSRLEVAEHRVERARIPAVDAHNHLGRWLSDDGDWVVPDVEAMIGQLDGLNVEAVINLDGRWGRELEANLDRYDQAYPGKFATFCHVDWREVKSPGFPDRLVSSLEDSASAGARGLKVWKDLGLRVRDHDGSLILPDDDHLAPLWDAAGRLGLPVLIHTADPVAFFYPLDHRNERLEELLEHPDWSFYGPEFPTFGRLMEALECIVANHPETTFIGAHVGCYAESLQWVGRMLDAYPNFHVDISARIAELGRQPRATRDLMLRHSDRVLFGTDVFPPDPEHVRVYFRFLETPDEYFPYSPGEVGHQGRWNIYGLGLPDDVLRKIYRDNARRLIPGISTAM
jgi:predicted TIM-barrel fold metal-dependent hydrolase